MPVIVEPTPVSVDVEPVPDAEDGPVRMQVYLTEDAPLRSAGYNLILGSIGHVVRLSPVHVTCTRSELLAAAKRAGLDESYLNIDLS